MSGTTITKAPADGCAWTSGENLGAWVVRGGSWISIEDKCRSAYRIISTFIYPFGHVTGFRVVVSSRTK